MYEKRKEVLAAEDAVLRLGKEAERMSATNKLLEGTAASVAKAKEEVAEARKEISRFAESTSSTNKRIEELVTSVNSRYDALETRLRGIDLEMTAVRKGVDGLEGSIGKTSSDILFIRSHLQNLGQGLRTMDTLIVIVLVVSVIGIVINFL